MTTTQHTPGPWKLAENPIGWQPLISAEVADSIGPIWHVGIANARGRSHEEAKANARLIAAAPDLLAALKLAKNAIDAALPWLHPDGYRKNALEVEDPHAYCGEIYEEINNAIAKAAGEDQP
jgi:hypothetical protein